MAFLNQEHMNRYVKVKEIAGFNDDSGEYAAFTYLITSDILNDINEKIFDCNRNWYNIDTANEILESDNTMSSAKRALLQLALNLYQLNKEGMSVIDLFSCLDRNNKIVATEAIKIAFNFNY